MQRERRSIRSFALAAIVQLFASSVAAREWQPTRHPEFEYRLWTVSHGLVSNVVTDMAEADDGYLWVSTLSGVSKFDGHAFTHADVLSDPGLTSNQVSSLALAPNGDLWLQAGDASLVRYDGRSFQRVDALDARVLTVANDESGRVVVNTNRGVLEPTDAGLRWRFGPTSPYGNTVQQSQQTVVFSSSGVWRTGWDHVFHIVGQDTTRTISAPRGTYGAQYMLPTIERLSDGRLVVFASSGPVVIDGDSHRQLPLETFLGPGLLASLDPMFSFHVNSATESTDGATWIGTTHGLFLVSDVEDGLTESDRVLDPSVMSPAGVVVIDRHKNVWVATHHGLVHIRRRLIRSVDLLPGSGPVLLAGPEHSFPFRFSRDTPTGGWLVGDGLPVELPGVVGIIVSPARRGGAWVAHFDGVFHLDDEGVDRDDIAIPFARRGWRSAYEDREGRLWHASDGTNECLSDPDVPRREGGVPWFVQRDGTVWLHNNTPALIRYHGNVRREFTEAGGLPASPIRAPWEDAAGRLWFTTRGHGLGCIEGDSVRVFTTARGLPHNTLGGMLGDRFGRVWINSNVGLFVVEAAALEDLVTDRRDRLPYRLVSTDECNARCVYGPGAEELYFETTSGFVAVTPSLLASSEVPPVARVTQVGVESSGFDRRDRNVLPADQRSVEISFTAPTLREAESVSFRYRLVGVDDAWVESGTRRQVFYSGLPPGEHRFEVIAANSAGQWASFGDGVDIVVPARLSETAWFRAGLPGAFALVILGGLLWRDRTRQRYLGSLRREVDRRRSAEDGLRTMGRRLINAQEDERRRIASELHDDVHQRLSLLTVELDMQETGAGRSSAELANEARGLSRDIHRLSHSLHPAKLEQLGLEAALTGYAAERTHRGDVSVSLDTFDVPDPLPNEVRLCLFRIAQEAVRNSEKYSGGADVSVTVRSVADGVELTVTDDGRGFDAAKRATAGLGLTSMAERAGSVGGTFRVDSAPGHGTTIHVVVPSS